MARSHVDKHSYILEPVSGNAKYLKLRTDDTHVVSQPLQKAVVNLDDVTISLSKVHLYDFEVLVLWDAMNSSNFQGPH